MSARHRTTVGAAHDIGEALFVPGTSLIHRLDPAAKIAAAVVFILIVVLTPITFGWPFAAYAAALAVVFVAAGLPARVLGRVAVEAPFVVFALLLPFVGRPPVVDVAGLALSEPGLWAAANILVKATLGVLTSIILAATTPSRDILDGLARLRVPPLMVEIAGFMIRFVHVVGDEWRRMTWARAARGFEGAGPRGWPVLARSAGVLFVRSYERGERVHLAMLARGYTGVLPTTLRPAVTDAPRWPAAVLPAVAGGVAVAAMLGIGTGG